MILSHTGNHCVADSTQPSHREGENWLLWASISTKGLERDLPSSSNGTSTASSTGPWVAAAAEATSGPLSGLHEPIGMPCGSRQLQWLSCPGSQGMAPGHRAGAHGKSATTTPSSASLSLKGCCTRERQPVITLMRSGQDSTWAISMYRNGTRTGAGGGGGVRAIFVKWENLGGGGWEM